jgi:hypothetical protein
MLTMFSVTSTGAIRHACAMSVFWRVACALALLVMVVSAAVVPPLKPVPAAPSAPSSEEKPCDTALPGGAAPEGVNLEVAECARQTCCHEAVMSGLCAWSVNEARAVPVWAVHSAVGDEHVWLRSIEECDEHHQD